MRRRRVPGPSLVAHWPLPDDVTSYWPVRSRSRSAPRLTVRTSSDMVKLTFGLAQHRFEHPHRELGPYHRLPVHWRECGNHSIGLLRPDQGSLTINMVPLVWAA